jgi:phi13 family phage major tail protein
MSNRIKYGLKNVHYAVATIAADGSATYSTPVPWPGAVSLSLDAEGEATKFRADDINYWISQANNGYSGDFESAIVPDSFKTDVLGYIVDAAGALVESVDALTKTFALMFQFAGDETETRHVLYYCTCSRPSVSGQTTEENIEPQTETVAIETGSVYNASLGANVAKASVKKTDAPYATWFEAVYQPVRANG